MTITMPTISQALRSLAEVHAENGRLRERIAQLEAMAERALPSIGPEPDFDTPLPDFLTANCRICGKSIDADMDLCEDCDDRAPLPCDAAE
jgi:hypothetical protein